MVKRYVVIFYWMHALLIFGVIESRLEDHFKMCLEKSTNHHMKNIDFTYIINLDQRPEKLGKCLDQLNPYGIFPYRFSAVNGWSLSLEAINDVGVKFEEGMVGGFWGTSYLPHENFKDSHEIIQNYGQTYFCHCMSRGAIGIFLSHLSVLQDAYDSGYETIWVMEDDIELIQNPHRLSDLIEQLDEKIGKNNWDVFYTDKDTRDQDGNYVPCYGMAQIPNFKPADMQQYYQRKNIDHLFCKLGARFGAYSMILRRSGIEKILNFVKEHNIFLPYDLEYYLPDGIQIYTVLDDVVGHLRNGLSDNGYPSYLE